MKNSICFLSSLNYTGGPLAIHQAAEAVNKQGGSACVVYVKNRKTSWSLRRKGSLLVDKLSIIQKMKIDSRLKKMKLNNQRVFSLDTHFIVPETRPDLAGYLLDLGCKRVSIWWLSVDNFPLNRLYHLDIQKIISRCSHLCQSHYAVQFLSSLPAKNIQMLSDVTEFDKYSVLEGHLENPFDIAYLPAKAKGAEEIIEKLATEFSVVALHNMDRATVNKTLSNSQIFLDFGHHPGKDRVPREAALAGAIPLIRYAGAAMHPEDVPLSEKFFIANEDFLNPEKILKICRKCIDNKKLYLAELQGYQQHIRKEDEIFRKEIRGLIEISEIN